MKVGETRTVTLAPGVEMTFCWIPPGRFRMGARGGYEYEEPVHEVEITRGFWLGQTPVTQRQYAVFDAEHENGFSGHPEHPAERMEWDRAVAFCAWLSARLAGGGWTDCTAGLPSEAQWEYACRAGTDTDYHTGDGVAALRRAGWFGGNAKHTTHPVGQREANGFGLCDMHGNVREWCRDAWEEYAYRWRAERVQEPEGVADAAAPARVVRGGAWLGSAWYCRAAARLGNRPGIGFSFLGFRVAVFPGPSCQDTSGGGEGSERAAGRRAGSARAPGGARGRGRHDSILETFRFLRRGQALMPFHLFQFPLPCQGDLDELNRFLAAHRVVAVRERIVESSGAALLVLGGAASAPGGRQDA